MQGSIADHQGRLIDVNVIKQNCEFLEEVEMLRLVEIFRENFQNLVAAPLSENEKEHWISAEEEHYIRGSAAMIGAQYIAENIKFLTETFLHAESREKISISLSIECIDQLNEAVQCTYRQFPGEL